jgi:ParB-like chromosome segregation protein Spo0J
MLEIRPIVVNDEMVVLGGNMRLRACQELGLKTIPVIKAADLTDDQQTEFMLKDNASAGTWDFDTLANSFDEKTLFDFGVINEDISKAMDNFKPELSPETNYADITDDAIRKEAQRLAEQIVAQQNTIPVTCPHCGNDFHVHASKNQ